MGTLPRLFARIEELFRYLTAHWPRLVEDTGAANRSRLPMHPTWVHLREHFARITPATPLLDEDTAQLLRGARYSGKSRVLRRLALGVVKSLEVEDAFPTSGALLSLCRWVERVADAESRRLQARCAMHQDRYGHVPP
jgi:hypothetical protein